MQVEVVAGWSLQITFLEWFTVPSAIALSHVHVVHVNRYPNIGCGIGYLIVHVFVDEEIVGF